MLLAKTSVFNTSFKIINSASSLKQAPTFLLAESLKTETDTTKLHFGRRSSLLEKLAIFVILANIALFFINRNREKAEEHALLRRDTDYYFDFVHQTRPLNDLDCFSEWPLIIDTLGMSKRNTTGLEPKYGNTLDVSVVELMEKARKLKLISKKDTSNTISKKILVGILNDFYPRINTNQGTFEDFAIEKTARSLLSLLIFLNEEKITLNRLREIANSSNNGEERTVFLKAVNAAGGTSNLLSIFDKKAWCKGSK